MRTHASGAASSAPARLRPLLLLLVVVVAASAVCAVVLLASPLSPAVALRAAPQPCRTPFACYIIFHENSSATVRPADHSNCTLYLLALETDVPVAPTTPKNRASATAIVKVAHSLAFALQFGATLHNAAAFASRWRNDAYLFVARARDLERLGSAPPHFAKALALEMVFNLKGGGPQCSFSHKHVLFMDLDAWFALPNTPIDHLLMTNKSLVMQGEQALCSCVLLFTRSDWSTRFVNRWASYGRSGRFNAHPWDQVALLHMLLLELHSSMPSFGYANECYKAPSSACLITALENRGHALPAALYLLPWGRVGFAPLMAPQAGLHNCMGGWPGCATHVALINHTGSAEYFRWVSHVPTSF